MDNLNIFVFLCFKLECVITDNSFKNLTNLFQTSDNDELERQNSSMLRYRRATLSRFLIDCEQLSS